MTTPRITAALVISDFTCSPDEVTHAMGIAPTQTWRVGDPSGLPGVTRTTNGWRLRSGLEDSTDLGLHLEWLLRRLPLAMPEVAEREGWAFTFSCGVTIDDRAPAMAFSAAVLSGIAALHAALDVDVIVAR